MRAMPRAQSRGARVWSDGAICSSRKKDAATRVRRKRRDEAFRCLRFSRVAARHYVCAFITAHNAHVWIDPQASGKAARRLRLRYTASAYAYGVCAIMSCALRRVAVSPTTALFPEPAIFTIDILLPVPSIRLLHPRFRHIPLPARYHALSLPPLLMLELMPVNRCLTAVSRRDSHTRDMLGDMASMKAYERKNGA